MRCCIALLGGLLALVSVAGGKQPSDTPDFFGIWRANEGTLPSVVLHVTNEGGTLAGAIMFYLIRREAGKEPTASPGIPEPLLHPKIDGNNLSFEVSHRLAHPPRTLSDLPVKFHLKFAGPNRAELTREEDNETIEMARDRQ